MEMSPTSKTGSEGLFQVASIVFSVRNEGPLGITELMNSLALILWRTETSDENTSNRTGPTEHRMESAPPTRAGLW